MFKSYKVYLQISRDQVTAIDLNTGLKVTRKAEQSFSSTRQILSNFNNAEITVRNTLKDLGVKRSFFALKVVIQQTEGTKGGLSDIEKRALRDIAEMAGANKVYIAQQERTLTLDEALQIIGQKK